MNSKLNRKYVSSNSILWFIYILIAIILSFGLQLPYPFNFIPLLIPIAVVSVVVIVKYPFFGLLIYLIFFLIRPQEFLSILSRLPVPLELITASLLLITLAFKLKREDKLQLLFTNIDKSILFFLFVAFLSMILSIWVDLAWVEWYKLFSYVIVYFMITQLVESKKQLNYFIYFIILTSVFHAGTSILNYYTGTYEYRMGIKRAVGMDSSHGSPNSLAATLAFTLPFLYYIFLIHKKLFYRIIIISISLLMLWCIILTGSRTGMVGVIFISIYLIWQNKNKFVNIFILVISSLILWVVMPPQYQERFISTTDISSDTGAASSAHGRIEGFVNGFHFMLDRPILGYGIGCWAMANQSIYGRGYFQAHSLPGQIMGELGMLGIMAFIIWIYYLFKNMKILKIYKFGDIEFNTKVKFLVISLKTQILSLFIFGLGGHNLYRYNWYIISAIIVVLLNLKRNESSIISISNDKAKANELPDKVI